jgi:serine/threonine protein kinase
LRSLDHPLIPKIIDIVKDPNDLPCIIMELCSNSLEEMIKEVEKEPDKIIEKDVLKILSMVSISLRYIHSKEIVHRDLKPHNILVANIGSKKIFLLSDFGISKKKGVSFITTVREKRTLLYSSIEQLKELDPRPSFDMYSLGVMAYRIMKGEVPY